EEAVQDIPRQLVVHPDANDVVVEVQTLVARKCRARRRGEIGFVLQSHVEIFNLPGQALMNLISTAPPAVQPPCPCWSGMVPTGATMLFAMLASAPPAVA